jgi:hypothetical protein
MLSALGRVKTTHLLDRKLLGLASLREKISRQPLKLTDQMKADRMRSPGKIQPAGK